MTTHSCRLIVVMVWCVLAVSSTDQQPSDTSCLNAPRERIVAAIDQKMRSHIDAAYSDARLLHSACKIHGAGCPPEFVAWLLDCDLMQEAPKDRGSFVVERDAHLMAVESRTKADRELAHLEALRGEIAKERAAVASRCALARRSGWTLLSVVWWPTCYAALALGAAALTAWMFAPPPIPQPHRAPLNLAANCVTTTSPAKAALAKAFFIYVARLRRVHFERQLDRLRFVASAIAFGCLAYQCWSLPKIVAEKSTFLWLLSHVAPVEWFVWAANGVAILFCGGVLVVCVKQMWSACTRLSMWRDLAREINGVEAALPKKLLRRCKRQV